MQRAVFQSDWHAHETSQHPCNIDHLVIGIIVLSGSSCCSGRRSSSTPALALARSSTTSVVALSVVSASVLSVTLAFALASRSA